MRRFNVPDHVWTSTRPAKALATPSRALPEPFRNPSPPTFALAENCSEKKLMPYREPTTDRLYPSGVPFRVCLFFAMNPDEELLSRDIAEKFQADQDNLHSTLRPACVIGWLTRSKERPEHHSCPWTYRAGPRLLREIGRAP